MPPGASANNPLITWIFCLQTPRFYILCQSAPQELCDSQNSFALLLIYKRRILKAPLHSVNTSLSPLPQFTCQLSAHHYRSTHHVSRLMTKYPTSLLQHLKGSTSHVMSKRPQDLRYSHKGFQMLQMPMHIATFQSAASQCQHTHKIKSMDMLPDSTIFM